MGGSVMQGNVRTCSKRNMEETREYFTSPEAYPVLDDGERRLREAFAHKLI
jgi:hypothetical protein